jgi:holo-[acyl-carrier protein] synthase
LIGIDIVAISRIEKILEKQHKDKFLLKFLSQDEIALTNNKPESIAGFFAVKEAISKALKCGIGSSLEFEDILLYKDKNNAPYFHLSQKAQKKFTINQSSISISHDGGFAIAVAVIL